MENLVLYCKSFDRDLDRLINLSKSIKKYNKDNIPFYVSVPSKDISLFKDKLPFYTQIISDESVFDHKIPSGWHYQQYIKSFFYKLKISKYYVSLDSDCYFFKDFYIKDFLFKDDIPYMVMTQHGDMLEWTDRFHKECFPFNPRESHENDYNFIKSIFNRDGKIYHYGPSPFIWNTEIWEWLDNKIGIIKAFGDRPNELNWYGEATLSKGDKFMPCDPLFKCFHYEAQYSFYKQLGWTEEHFKPQFFGIVMQSNCNLPINY